MDPEIFPTEKAASQNMPSLVSSVVIFCRFYPLRKPSLLHVFQHTRILLCFLFSWACSRFGVFSVNDTKR